MCDVLKKIFQMNSECPHKSTTNSNGPSECPHLSSKQQSPLIEHVLKQQHPSPLSFVDGSSATVDKDAASRNGFTSTDTQYIPNDTSSSGLPQRRQVSSIPRTPGTENDKQESEYWMYPSQQQFYNAMKRKNYAPDANDMSVIVPMHNIINERAWSSVLQWESRHYCDTCPATEIKLKSFKGRPQDPSPKAFIWSTILGGTAPFDRHDWVVDRCGQEVRYVLDFYPGKAKAVNGIDSFVSVYMDVRPALDSPQALMDRVTVGLQEMLASMKAWTSDSTSNSNAE